MVFGEVISIIIRYNVIQEGSRQGIHGGNAPCLLHNEYSYI